MVLAWVSYLVLGIPVLRGEYSEQQVLADRYTYLAALPLTLLIAVFVKRCLSRSMHRWGKWSLILASGFTLFLLVELGILSRYQARVWHDSEALWKYAVAANPNSGAYFNLATEA